MGTKWNTEVPYKHEKELYCEAAEPRHSCPPPERWGTLLLWRDPNSPGCVPVQLLQGTALGELDLRSANVSPNPYGSVLL